jgi:hypothetical protein
MLLALLGNRCIVFGATCKRDGFCRKKEELRVPHSHDLMGTATLLASTSLCQLKNTVVFVLAGSIIHGQCGLIWELPI